MKRSFLPEFVGSLRIAVATAAAAFSLSLHGEPLVLTWAGGASGTFSTGAWSGGVEGHESPQAGDILVFGSGGTFENDIEGLSVGGLTFTSPDAVTLTGSQVAVAGGGALTTTGAGPVTFNVPLSLGVAGSTVSIDVAEDCTNTFNACVSGGAKIEYVNEGAVNLYADSDYTGDTVVRLGQIHVYADGAFGSTEGSTSISLAAKDSNANVYFHGITTGENFSNNTRAKTDAVRFPAGTTNIFNGTYSEEAADQYSFGENTRIVFNGKAYFGNPSTRDIPLSSVIEFNGDGTAFGYEYATGGTFIYGNKCVMNNGFLILGRGGISQRRDFRCENAMLHDVNRPGVFGVLGGRGSSDLGGYDQTFWYVSCTSLYSASVITSAAPSTVHFTLGTNKAPSDSYPRTCCATFKGPVSLSFDGPLPMSMGTASPATGSISLSNGSDVTLLDGFGWGGDSVEVTDGSSLTISGDVTLHENVVISISDRESTDETAAKFSRITLDSSIRIGSLMINGMELEAGRSYGSSESGAQVQDDDHFAGRGRIIVSGAAVDSMTFTWAGGASGNLSEGPWSGGEAGHETPQSGDVLVFGAGGVFSNDIAGLTVSGLTFTSSDAVTLTGDPIVLMNGGRLVTDGTGPVTFDVPFFMGDIAHPPVTIDVAPDSTNTFNGCIFGFADIVYAGTGTINLMAVNDYLGDTVITSGVINVHADNSFGAAGSSVMVQFPQGSSILSNRVCFYGVTLDNDFDMHTKYSQFSIIFEHCTTNVFNGRFIESDPEVYVFGTNTLTVFNGQTRFASPSSRTIPGSAVIELNGEGTSFGWECQSGGDFHYNTICRMNNGFIGVGRSHLQQFRRLNILNPFVNSTGKSVYIDVVGHNGMLDLCGLDHTFRFVRSAAAYPGSGITSSVPCTLHLDLWKDNAVAIVTNRAAFYGPVSLSFEGPLPMQLGTVSPATGSLSLSNGSNVMLLDGFGWGGESLAVTDGSSLTIDGSVTFPESLSLSVSDRQESEGVSAKSSRIVLDEDFTVYTLEINGAMMPGGRTYGSSASSAAVKDDVHFSGTGVLRVKYPCGLRVILR